ncbi:protein phosphatase methylesterase [Polychaeton citri CBS 116435]|uniref:Protein phosphatase methylesterase 1 n=1 Tax=Polychaeton citri CBS 116435 TaxID=1314669 RepID=A0A9P4PYT1_9PEZI|nr:protein phosphatase methylesterase [Polychaeton citri CBS 116435]
MPHPHLIAEDPEVPLDSRHSYSSSSDSSASSVASVNTIRPSSREQEAPSTHWTNFFSQDLYLPRDLPDGSRAQYHAYLTPPANPAKDPLFICHHGAGSSGLSFACFARDIRLKLPAAGILSLEARGHGNTSVSRRMPNDLDAEVDPDFSLPTLVDDAVAAIDLARQHMGWQKLPPAVLVGHSLGGAVLTTVATQTHFGGSLIGYAVIDVVEGSAVEALSHMKTYLSSRPSLFASIGQAIDWHVRSRTIRDRESAEVSVPSLLLPTLPSGGKYRWRTDLTKTQPWWPEWFQGLSQKFLKGKGAKLLILAGTDRLDKDLMIGQMQGKFQLTVLPEAGHFVQEDFPEKAAQLLLDFFRRNDRSTLVLPPKVSDLIAQGKKV